MRAEAAVQRRLVDLADLDLRIAGLSHRRAALAEQAEVDRLEGERRTARESAARARIAVEDLDRAIAKLDSDVEAVRRRRERDEALVAGGELPARQVVEVEHELGTLARREAALGDVAAAAPRMRFALLRYFNPVGAHASGTIGEDPSEVPNNLMPYIAQVAVGRRDKLSVFGADYDTPDGTGVRDYIHVEDLAAGHIAALQALATTDLAVNVWNLGSGRGTSVLELLRAFEKAVGRELPYEIVARRPGDVASSYADPSKANEELGWLTTRSVEDMCADTWRWQSQNPHGFAG